MQKTASPYLSAFQNGRRMKLTCMAILLYKIGGRWKLLYKGSGNSAVFRYPLFCSAAFCSKPAEGSGRQRKCVKRVAKMRNCAFWLSSKGSADGSGRQRGWQRKKRAWGSENAQGSAEESKGSAHGKRKCARTAKMLKGSENKKWQRKSAVAVKMRSGSENQQWQRWRQRGTALRQRGAANLKQMAAKMRRNCAFSLSRTSFCSDANFDPN